MSLPIQILDGLGKGFEAQVTEEHALKVSQVVTPLDPVGTENRLRFLSGLMGTTGLNSGSTAMSVNGSSTPIEFFINAEAEVDLYIIKVVFSLVDNTVAHDRFGSLSGGLTNGVDLIVTESGQETFIIEKAKTFYDMIMQTVVEAPFGDASTSFEITNVDGNADAQVLPFTIGNIIPGGLRLGRGTTDNLRFVVRDNVTAVNDMRVRVLGYRKYT